MNTSEQLKNESIDRIWIAKIGEHNYLPDRKYALENDGFILLRRFQETMISEQVSSNDYEQKAFAIEFRKPDVMHIRPIELSGIENNNGWIELNPNDNIKQGSYELINIDNPSVYSVRTFNVIANDIRHLELFQHYTHYKPIEKSNPPIF